MLNDSPPLPLTQPDPEPLPSSSEKRSEQSRAVSDPPLQLRSQITGRYDTPSHSPLAPLNHLAKAPNRKQQLRISAPDLRKQARVEEVIVRIQLAERMLVQQRISRRPFTGRSAFVLAHTSTESARRKGVDSHLEAIEHQAHGIRADRITDIIRDRRRLVQATELIHRTHSLLLAPRPAPREHLEHHTA